MQTSAEIHSPQTRGEMNIIEPTQTIYTWGNKPSSTVGMGKGKRKRDYGTHSQPTDINNLTAFKWLSVPIYDKTHFQSGKEIREAD